MGNVYLILNDSGKYLPSEQFWDNSTPWVNDQYKAKSYTDLDRVLYKLKELSVIFPDTNFSLETFALKSIGTVSYKSYLLSQKINKIKKCIKFQIR